MQRVGGLGRALRIETWCTLGQRLIEIPEMCTFKARFMQAFPGALRLCHGRLPAES
jgi:hypothetical protein